VPALRTGNHIGLPLQILAKLNHYRDVAPSFRLRLDGSYKSISSQSMHLRRFHECYSHPDCDSKSQLVFSDLIPDIVDRAGQPIAD